MGLFPTCDLKLTFDPAFACDFTIDGGDLALDTTPATPMLVSLGTDRRARADDRLPDGVSPISAPVRWSPRRGWVGDCLSRTGRRIGARLWLLSREHDDETTRMRAEAYAAEGLAWAKRDFAIDPEISATWVRTGILKLRAMIDGRAVTLTKRVS